MKANSKEICAKSVFIFCKKNGDVSIFVWVKLWLLPVFLWIPVAVAKTYFFYMVLIWQKDCVKTSCVNAYIGMFNTFQYTHGTLLTLHISDTLLQHLVQLALYWYNKIAKKMQEYFLRVAEALATPTFKVCIHQGTFCGDVKRDKRLRVYT